MFCQQKSNTLNLSLIYEIAHAVDSVLISYLWNIDSVMLNLITKLLTTVVIFQGPLNDPTALSDQLNLVKEVYEILEFPENVNATTGVETSK